MSQIDIQDLFNKTRFPSGLRLLAVILYSPFGVLLVLLRLLITLQLWLLASLLPDCNPLRKYLSYGISIVFGIIIKIDTEGELRDKKSRIIIANNVSVLDHFALRQTTETLTPSVWELPTALSNALGLQKMDMSSKEVLIDNIKHFLCTSTYSVAIQPEFGTTNSRVALLKFNSWPFSIESCVQPVAIKASRPEFVSVHITSLASTWWIEVFWFMFVPYTVFTLKYLKIKQNPDHDILVREVEKDIADALGIRTSSHTVSDKTEYEKRYRMERILSNTRSTRNTPNSQVSHSTEIQRMVRQVSEVLPMVPHSVILRDLLKTRNIDVTIANILDGIVTYTPDPNPSAHSSVTSSASSSSSKDKILGTSSFQEKKIKMIQEARERYIKKHGLTNC